MFVSRNDIVNMLKSAIYNVDKIDFDKLSYEKRTPVTNYSFVKMVNYGHIDVDILVKCRSGKNMRCTIAVLEENDYIKIIYKFVPQLQYVGQTNYIYADQLNRVLDTKYGNHFYVLENLLIYEAAGSVRNERRYDRSQFELDLSYSIATHLAWSSLFDTVLPAVPEGTLWPLLIDLDMPIIQLIVDFKSKLEFHSRMNWSYMHK